MNVTASITVDDGMTVEELRKTLDSVPGGAKISITSYNGDRPGESSYSTMEFRWDIKNGPALTAYDK